jgi:uncharacterized membrane protein
VIALYGVRIETVRAWMLAGFSLILAGLCLYAFKSSSGGGKLAMFVAAMGLVYLNLGLVLTFIHDRHMAKRTRAGRE